MRCTQNEAHGGGCISTVLLSVVQMHELQMKKDAVQVIAVTTVINLPASGGRREFVYDCGVIGLCPPCTRATPLTGVGSLLVGGWGREPCAHAPESKPTRQQGSCALLAGGSLPRALPRVNPPANRDSVPCCQGGEVARILHLSGTECHYVDTRFFSGSPSQLDYISCSLMHS